MNLCVTDLAAPLLNTGSCVCLKKKEKRREKTCLLSGPCYIAGLQDFLQRSSTGLVIL